MQRKFRAPLLLAVITVLLLVPAVLWREVEGLEFRTALFVRHILESGPSLIPRLYDSPYYDYPPLYFLLAAVPSGAAASLSPLSLALPGVLAAAATVFICCLFAGALGRRVGWMAGAALIATPVFLHFGSQASVDMTLTFFISLCLVSYHLYLSSRKGYLLLLSFLGLAGAALTKGPVGAVLPLFIILAYLAVLRRTREFVFTSLRLGLFLLVFTAVFASAVILSEGSASLRELADAQLLDRVMEEPNEARAYYVGVFFAGFAPWSLCAFFQLFRRAGSDDREKILLLSKVWLLMTFVIFTIARIKHTRYLLPLAPPTAILCAAFWVGYLGSNASRYLRAFLSFIRVVCIAALAIGTAGTLLAPLWLPFASIALLLLLPLLGAAVLAVCAARPLASVRNLFLLLVSTICFGFLVYCQFGLPYECAKNDARPFVFAAEREAQDLPVVFFAINNEKEGLRYSFWSGGDDDLSFTTALDELESVLSHEAPAIVVAPAPWSNFLQVALGERLEFLLDERMGKKRYSAFCWSGGDPGITRETPQGP